MSKSFYQPESRDDIPDYMVGSRWLKRRYREANEWASNEWRNLKEDPPGNHDVSAWQARLEVSRTGVYREDEYVEGDPGVWAIETSWFGSSTERYEEREDAWADPPDNSLSFWRDQSGSNQESGGVWAFVYTGTNSDGDPLSGSLSPGGFIDIVSVDVTKTFSVSANNSQVIETETWVWDGIDT
ncbi:MAG: hypothetical protein ACQKBY_06000, partial [Verrucomicrobiales bacterium]